METTTRLIGGHRRVRPRRRGRAAVITAGLVGAVALTSGAGAEAATPTVTYSGLCALGVANLLSPSTSSLDLGPGGSVKVVNDASTLLGKATLKVTDGNGRSVTLGGGDHHIFTYPGSTSVKTYTLTGSCAAVALSGPVSITVAAKDAPAKPAEPPAQPGAGSGSGSGAGSGSGGGTGSGSGTGTGSTGGAQPPAGQGPAQPPTVVPGVDTAGAYPGTGLPPGFANPPVALSAPGAGTVPIPDVKTTVPGAPAQANPPQVDLFDTGAAPVPAAAPETRPLAVTQESSAPSLRVLLILVATVLFLGVGAAAVRAVRGARVSSSPAVRA
jgi:hypothetical protein